MKPTLEAVLAALAAVLVVSPAYAYVDPNAGGLIFQVLTPIVSVMAATAAFFGRQIVRMCLSVVYAGKRVAARVLRTIKPDPN